MKKKCNQQAPMKRRWWSCAIGLGVAAAAVLWLGRPAVEPEPLTPLREPAISITRAGAGVHTRSHAEQVATESPGATSSPRAGWLHRQLHHVRAGTDPIARTAAMEHLTRFVDDADIGSVLAGLSREELATEFASLLTRRWANHDPTAAASWINQLPAGAVREEMTGQLLVRWGGADLPAACEWARQLPAGAGQERALKTLAYEAARSDPVAALEIAVTLPVTGDRDQLLSHALSEWASSDPLAAAQWAAGVSDETVRAHLVAGLAGVVAGQDGAMASELIALALPPGEIQSRAAVEVVQRWVQVDALRAAGWVERFGAGVLQDAVLQNFLDLWTDHDVQAAGEWVSGLPSGSFRDQALGRYAAQITLHDPQLARRWAYQIQDRDLQQDAVTAVSRRWSALQPNGAP